MFYDLSATLQIWTGCLNFAYFIKFSNFHVLLRSLLVVLVPMDLVWFPHCSKKGSFFLPCTNPKLKRFRFIEIDIVLFAMMDKLSTSSWIGHEVDIVLLVMVDVGDPLEETILILSWLKGWLCPPFCSSSLDEFCPCFWCSEYWTNNLSLPYI